MGREMEWCGQLYKEWKLEGYVDKARKVVLVTVVLCICVFCMKDVSILWSPAGDLSYEKNSEKAVDGRMESIEKMSVMPERPETVSEVAGSETGAADISQDTVDAGTLEQTGQMEESYVQPVLPLDPPEEEAVFPPISENPAVPEDSEDMAPVIPQEPENTFPEIPVVNGFYVDEAGMITGIADPSVVCEGYMELPSEGCSGISAGAFSAGAEMVREIYIPANIIQIESGAFTGLDLIEWFEKEASGGFYTEDGVLFSEEGSVLFAFPPARTGTYKVPAHVMKFADDAFKAAQISALDLTETTGLDVGNLPEDIVLYH